MDWKTTFEEILAERRQGLGPPPTLDELIALRAGELPDDDRQRLLELASVDREVARELFDVLRFPEPAGDRADEAGVEERWRAFRDRLAAEGHLPAGEPPSAGAAYPAWLPLAAMFVLGVAAALTVDRLRGPDVDPARINLPIVELLPAGGAGVRGAAETVTLEPEAGGLVLALSVPALPPGGGPYALELAPADGDATTLEGLAPGAGGVFVLEVPRERWTSGSYELRLSDAGGRQVARFELEVELRR